MSDTVYYRNLSERISNVEKNLDAEKKQTDNRFDFVIEKFEDCDISDQIDAIPDLEFKYTNVAAKIEDLN